MYTKLSPHWVTITAINDFSCSTAVYMGRAGLTFPPWYLPSFSSKRGHVIEKHVLIGCKHDMLGNQTFEVLQPLSKLSRQGLKVFEFVGMFSINKYGRNFKPGIPLSKDVRNDVIQRYERSIFSRLQFRSTYFSYHV